MTKFKVGKFRIDIGQIVLYEVDIVDQTVVLYTSSAPVTLHLNDEDFERTVKKLDDAFFAGENNSVFGTYEYGERTRGEV